MTRWVAMLAVAAAILAAPGPASAGAIFIGDRDDSVVSVTNRIGGFYQPFDGGTRLDSEHAISNYEAGTVELRTGFTHYRSLDGFGNPTGPLIGGPGEAYARASLAESSLKARVSADSIYDTRFFDGFQQFSNATVTDRIDFIGTTDPVWVELVMTLDGTVQVPDNANASLSYRIFGVGGGASREYATGREGADNLREGMSFDTLRVSFQRVGGFDFRARLELSVSSGEGTAFDLDFANSADFQINVQDGVQYTSQSGFFTSTTEPGPSDPTPVPAPGTLVLLGIGLLGLVVARGRRESRA